MAISAFHSFCNRLVREYSPSPDAEKLLTRDEDITFLLLDRFDTLTFLSSRSFKADPVKAVRRSFVPFLSRLRDELLSAREIESQLAEFESMEKLLHEQFPSLSEKTDPEEILRQFKDLIQVYRSCEDWKRELKVVDYSDMILDCWEMLKGDPAILDKVRKDCRHIIIDEYQDNNYALNRIATLIAGDEPDLTVVGDEDQCIYSFRGANYHNVRDFRQKYGVTKNEGETALEENHRSTQEILDLANVSISHDSHRTPKTLISATGRHGPKPVWHVGTRRQTLGEIPRLVKKLVNEERKYYGDIALLCRSRNHVKAVAESLQWASIPTDVFVERFFSVPAVRTLLAWGHLICGDSRSEMALFRIHHEYASRSFAERISQALHEDEDDDVIDYKTSKIKEKANRNLQLALYTEAIQRNVVEGVMGRPGSARLHFLCHPDDPIESHTFSEEDLEKQFKKIKQVSEGIRRREFEPTTGWHCDYCDYRDFLCPAWEEE